MDISFSGVFSSSSNNVGVSTCIHIYLGTLLPGWNRIANAKGIYILIQKINIAKLSSEKYVPIMDLTNSEWERQFLCQYCALPNSVIIIHL